MYVDILLGQRSYFRENCLPKGSFLEENQTLTPKYALLIKYVKNSYKFLNLFNLAMANYSKFGPLD